MNYKVTTLTPLLVGDGRELAPIDYMVWKDQVNVLDQPRIFKLLSRGPRLDGYLAQLQKATKLDFASWGGFAQNFSERRIPFEHPSLTPLWEKAPSENLFIATFAGSLQGPYLPASALKGALRTGLIFSRWTASTMDKIAAALEPSRPPRRPAEAAENTSGASQVRIVTVADSKPVAASAFRVFLARVATLDSKQPGSYQLAWKVAGRGSVPNQRITESTPDFVEMAVPGTQFGGIWSERKFLENPELIRALGWRSVPEPKLIVDAANAFAEAQLKLHSHYAETAGLTAVRESLKAIEAELSLARSTPLTCLLCLGWGTGLVAKSGSLDFENESYRTILRSIPAYSRAIRTGLPFPKTRRVIFSNGQPAALPGWVKLQLAS
ncbi:MAG: RAMP superfamily CRISPR-associated protein [Bryobacteraceae bacterium]